MPFELWQDDDGGWYVQNKQTGRRKNKKPLSRAAAIRYQRALEANTMDDKKSVKHGAIHNAAEKDKLQAIHDHSVSMGADCGMDNADQSKSMKAAKYMLDSAMTPDAALAYAREELADINLAASVLQSLASLMMDEIDEPDDRAEVSAIMRAVMEFIGGEIDEMEQAAGQDDAADAGEIKHAKEPAQLAARNETPKLDLSYAKSLGIALPDDELAKKLAVKFIGRDEILHPVFLWGDAGRMDIEKDFFNRNTDFWDKSLGGGPRPLTWDHGQDAEFKAANPVVGKTVEWTDDDMGRWATSVLDKDKAYRKYIDKFIEQKALGSSSDSAPQYVVREKAGKGNWIKQWPWIASALTPMPAEPRMKVFTPEFLKSWNFNLPEALDEQVRQLEALTLRERELRLRKSIGV